MHVSSVGRLSGGLGHVRRQDVCNDARTGTACILEIKHEMLFHVMNWGSCPCFVLFFLSFFSLHRNMRKWRLGRRSSKQQVFKLQQNTAEEDTSLMQITSPSPLTQGQPVWTGGSSRNARALF